MTAIFAFDHDHAIGDLCSRATCNYARRSPALVGNTEVADMPLIVLRRATEREYLEQPLPSGYVLPPLDFGCDYFFEVRENV